MRVLKSGQEASEEGEAFPVHVAGVMLEKYGMGGRGCHVNKRVFSCCYTLQIQIQIHRGSGYLFLKSVKMNL